MIAEDPQAATESQFDAASPAGHSRWRRVLRSPTVWIFVAVSIVGVVLVDWMDDLGGPLAFHQKFGFFAPIMSIGLQVILALTPIPSDIVAIANGVIYDFKMGVSLSWLGWWIAAQAEFALGRRARHDFNLETALAKAPWYVRSLPVSHPAYLILSRQIPWLGGHISTFVPGAAGVHWRRYLWCSAIAILPGSLVMTGIGVGIMRLPT